MKKLKEIRRERGMNQRELARRSGLSQAAISKLEGGQIKDPNLRTLTKLAEALEVHPLTLTDWPVERDLEAV